MINHFYITAIEIDVKVLFHVLFHELKCHFNYDTEVSISFNR